MSASEKVRALLDERGIAYEAPSATCTEACINGIEYTFYEDEGKVFATTEWLAPEQAIAATVGNTMTLDEATERIEKFMGDYAKVLLESTLYVERDEPTNQHALDVAEQKEAQMARYLAEALATAGVGTCHTVGMSALGNPPFSKSGLSCNSMECGCSECGAPWSTMGIFRGNKIKHNFKACPICGRKVVK